MIFMHRCESRYWICHQGIRAWREGRQSIILYWIDLVDISCCSWYKISPLMHYHLHQSPPSSSSPSYLLLTLSGRSTRQLSRGSLSVSSRPWGESCSSSSASSPSRSARSLSLSSSSLSSPFSLLFLLSLSLSWFCSCSWSWSRSWWWSWSWSWLPLFLHFEHKTASLKKQALV